MKAKRGKCLALVAVLAMVVCAFAIAMPSGESDAASTLETGTITPDLKELTTTISADGSYWTSKNVTITSISSGATSVNIYLVGTGSVKLPANIGSATVKVYLAVDNGSTPASYYTGLKLTGANSGTYTASGMGISTAATIDPADTYGISVKISKDAAPTHYPTGYDAKAISLSEGGAVTIIDGSAKIICGTSSVEAVSVKSTAGANVATVSAVAAGASSDAIPKISGVLTSGDISILGGKFDYTATGGTITGVEVTIPATDPSGSPTTSTYYASSIPADKDATEFTIKGKVTQKTSVTATGADLTLDSGSDLFVDSGANLKVKDITNNGSILVFGTLGTTSTTPLTFNVGPNGYVYKYTGSGAAETKEPITPAANTNVTSGEDYKVYGEAQDGATISTAIIGSTGLTILDGTTVTLNGNLGLNGETLTVNGTLVIAEGSSIYGGVADSKIVLGPNGKIVNNGKIAVNYEIVVSKSATIEDATETIYVQGVSGVEFSYFSNTLSVAGNIQALKNSAGTSKVVLVGAGIAGDLTIGKDVEFDAATRPSGTVIAAATNHVNVPKGATVTVDGYLVASPDLGEGARLIVNGTIAAGATVKVTVGKYNTDDNAFSEEGIVTLVTAMDKVTGFTVYGKRVVENDKYLLKAFINGTIADGDLTSSAGTAAVTFTGDITVAAGETLVIKNTVTVAPDASTFYVLGTVTDESASGVLGVHYIGAYYVVSTTSTSAAGTTTPVKTGYYTPIAKAMAEIDSAENKTVTIIANDLNENITVGNGQTVDLTVSGTVGADAVVTYDAGSKGTAVIGEVKGKVVVSGKSAATPSITTYASLKTDSDGTRTYSGFEVALKEANAGDVIEISSDEVGSVIIPAGVTVKVTDTLTINGNLTIPETAKLVGGNIVMKGANREINVEGDLDLSDGALTTADSSSNYTITSTGKSVLQTKSTSANGAYYVDTAGNYVLTSVAKAVAYVNENESVNSIEVVGTYTETAPVTLDGVNMKVTGSSITLGDVTLVEGTKITATGKLTANVISKSGSGNEAAVKLTKASATLESKKVTSAAGADTYTFTVSGLSGEMNVTKGTVSVPTEALAGILTVDSGAELLIDKGVSFDATGDDAAIIDNGTVTVKGTLKIYGSVAGTLAVAEGGIVTATALNVTGTVAVDAAGSFTVSGRVDVGTAMTTLGAAASVTGSVKFSGNGYIVAYPGSDMSKAVMPEGVKSTKFHVNDTLFATAYTTGAVRDTSAVTTRMVNAIVGFDDISTVVWNDSEGNVAGNVGDQTDVYVTLKASTVSVAISSGSGLSLWVDGVKYNSGIAVDLTVGEHKVQVTVNPGYKGDAAVTFNGASVTDGKIVVTADMVGGTSIVLSAAGNISVDTGDSGSGSSIAEILLIVLVVLAAVLVVLVALRMMRS